MNFTHDFFEKVRVAIGALKLEQVDQLVDLLAELKSHNGRLFILGNGGSAGHASHATNDFRKLCDIETYCPTDNVSELTARINDEGWENCLADWLKVSRLNSKDALLVISVGGGNNEKNVSPNINKAIDLAKNLKAKVLGIVGKDGGYTKQKADACVIIPPVDSNLITPITEGLAAVVWHLIVSHPKLSPKKGKWESITK